MPAISPARAANVATHAWTKLHWNHELNFWHLWVPFMHGPTWSDPVNHCPYWVCTVCERPAVVSKAQTKIRLPRVLKLQSSSLWVADAALWQSDFHWPSNASQYRSLWNIWMRSFKIYCKWSVQASKHTHVHNEVTLVWGLLRLGPTIMMLFLCMVIGASLSEPHTSETTLHICMLDCLFACLDRKFQMSVFKYFTKIEYPHVF